MSGIILTVDVYNGQCVSIRQGKVEHNNVWHKNPEVYLEESALGLWPDLVVTDLNRAFNNNDLTNVPLVTRLARRYNCYVAGGIRDVETARYYLDNGAKRVYVNTWALATKSPAAGESSSLSQIPEDRLVLAFDVDNKRNLLTHGRKSIVDGKVCNLDEALRLPFSNKCVVTCQDTEGTEGEFPNDLYLYLLNKAKEYKKKIYLAGGRWSLDFIKRILLTQDAQFLGIQMGKTLHQGILSLGQIVSQCLAKFSLQAQITSTSTDSNPSSASNPNKSNLDLIPIAIQSTDGTMLGLVYGNRETVEQSINERKGIYYSRSRNKVWVKGEESGNTQVLKRVYLDCDRDTLLYVVEQRGNFCHNQTRNCFNSRDVNRNGLLDLEKRMQEWKDNKTDSSYFGKLMQDKNKLKRKVTEEARELLCCANSQEVAKEGADLILHLMAYLRSLNIPISDVLDEINARQYKVTPSSHWEFRNRHIKDDQQLVVAYCKGRQEVQLKGMLDSLAIGQIKVIGVKPRDISTLFANKFIDVAVAYDDNFLDTDHEFYDTFLEDKSISLSICLCMKQGREMEELKLAETSLVLTEFPEITEAFLKKSGFDKCKVKFLYGSVDDITGSGLCDACVTIVETGSSLKRNGLKVVAELMKVHPKVFVRREVMENVVGQFRSRENKGEDCKLDGNDGTGKSTLAHLLEYHRKTRVKERGILTKLTDLPVPSLPDQLPWEERPDFVLVCQPPISRMRKRMEKDDKYHSPEALFYYDAKYRMLAAKYTLPMVDTTFLYRFLSPLPAIDDEKFESIWTSLKTIAEGESKIVKQYGNDFEIICYKPTVYSHTKQRAGIIPGTDVERMRATRAFLELLWRNQIPHSYIYVGKKYILARKLPVNKMLPLEFVVKRFYCGTDRHRYPLLKDVSLPGGMALMQPSTRIQGEMEYLQPYVRIDCRNPNHTPQGEPLGDFAMSESLVSKMGVEVAAVQNLCLKTFGVLEKFLDAHKIAIKDICFMALNDGSMLYGEISQDNARYYKYDVSSSLDKDVWRSGGSHDAVLEKWKQLSEIVENAVYSLPKFIQ